MAELTSKDIAALKARAHELDVTLQVGKAGVTPGLAEELKDQLKRHELVKVRLLRSAREGDDRDALASALAEMAGAVLVEVRGNTAVFYAPPKRRR